jgi:hypothetical protein
MSSIENLVLRAKQEIKGLSVSKIEVSGVGCQVSGNTATESET